MSIEPQPCYVCPSCGVPFSEHMGLIETCRELIEVDVKLQKSEEALKKLLDWRIQAETERDRYKEALQQVKNEGNNAKKQLDYLVEICGKAAKWKDEDCNYIHTIAHIENVISNLRIELKTEKHLRKQAEEKQNRYKEALEALKEDNGT